ncbi:folylpolyglutamate synthase [Xylona heveae TC161]|uniref:Dihydrofolate synthetase n=1 Tax=Xylona heveae (strain CBS 132557 / TC161) TaxID=1328760 RepID=A0A165JWZ8_XYLHT|nr:folylpolyglutamate synthase [Xylona heveae TC161]KZF26729.1 folylpolyglutamate synthase [Xylona heveae TC161]
MIELGLARIGRLLSHTKLPWRAIHVAGTNGKGSICAYASAMLRAGGIRCGRFTSPHLIDRWDCITIDEVTVAESLFREVEKEVQARNEKDAIGASEFEVLTATAFEIFTRENIELGVVEVGLGGRLDATNILENPLVTVISKIGQDHQSFLGNTLEQIAWQKAGILKPGVPCVVDGTNQSVVLDVVRGVASEVKAGSVFAVEDTAHTTEAGDAGNGEHVGGAGNAGSEGNVRVVVGNAGNAGNAKSFSSRVWEHLPQTDFEDHQRMNILCSFQAFILALKAIRPNLDPWHLLPAVARAQWPGRLQRINIESLTGRSEDVLLDGAHNAQSADALGAYVNKRLRQRQTAESQPGPVTWVLSLSKGKDVLEILRPLIRDGDSVAAVMFGPVDGMPWVKPALPADILEGLDALGLHNVQKYDGNDDILGTLKWASQSAQQRPLVVAGSLYLVSSMLRLLRERSI